MTGLVVHALQSELDDFLVLYSKVSVFFGVPLITIGEYVPLADMVERVSKLFTRSTVADIVGLDQG